MDPAGTGTPSVSAGRGPEAAGGTAAVPAVPRSHESRCAPSPRQRLAAVGPRPPRVPSRGDPAVPAPPSPGPAPAVPEPGGAAAARPRKLRPARAEGGGLSGGPRSCSRAGGALRGRERAGGEGETSWLLRALGVPAGGDTGVPRGHGGLPATSGSAGATDATPPWVPSGEGRLRAAVPAPPGPPGHPWHPRASPDPSASPAPRHPLPPSASPDPQGIPAPPWHPGPPGHPRTPSASWTPGIPGPPGHPWHPRHLRDPSASPAPPGHLRDPLGIPGTPRASPAPPGHPRDPQGIPGTPSASPGPLGHPQDPFGIPGTPWASPDSPW
ncbi:collagen alpha-1(X) chain-like [Serinus canaria]|uniref:collagen alpha-1(X) chain-like n=1 Tax=Serinus canaria TaxID=9135 RepID=UPI0021CC6C14|nr:collagen alpha-1(X) chain-like [Serinus canaria]